MLPRVELTAEGLEHRFDRRLLWRGVTARLRNGETLGVTGANGAGKTTLLRALAGLLTPTAGTLSFTLDGASVERDEIVRHCGFVAPYLNLYEEFTPTELYGLLAQMRGERSRGNHFDDILQRFTLYERRNDVVKSFSSGMKQRLKHVFAFVFEPVVVFLDEPMTNLDEAGIKAVEVELALHKERGGACALATNDARDLALSDARLSVEDFAPSREFRA
jgi:heme exporter protein A